MNKKVSLGVALSMAFLLVALAVTVTALVTMQIYNGIIKDVAERSNVYASVSEIDDIVRENYFGELNESLLTAMMTDGYVDGIGDRYSTYMTADEYAEFKDGEKGKKGGIGVIAVYDSNNNNIYVSEVSKDSPAQLQGVVKGDVITAVDSVAVTPYNYQELIDSLSGEKLTNVQIAFTHNGENKTASIPKGYSAQSVFYSVNDKIGYIKITDFYGTTAQQLREAMKYMAEKSVSSIIFDLRNNETGLIKNAAECLDILVPVAAENSGALATAVDKKGKTLETFSSDSESVNYNMIVLVNGKTAGAAELFACDLRDFGMARLLGTKTVGNGTMQKIFELSDGSAVSLTVAKIIPYKSESFNKIGLEPDIKVELTPEQTQRLEMLTPEEDLQYSKAVELLTSK